MTARHGDPIPSGNSGPPGFGQLREPIGPARGGAVGGGGVQEPHPAIRRQGRRFPGRLIRQAQESDIRRLEHGLAGRIVLAQLGVDFQQFHCRMLQQPLADAQAGGARLAIDKRFDHGQFLSLTHAIWARTCAGAVPPWLLRLCTQVSRLMAS